MAAISHITKPGHRCKNPLRGTKAGNIRAGERLQLGNWELWGVERSNIWTYFVNDVSKTGDHFEFTNFNCAAAKLAELGA